MARLDETGHAQRGGEGPRALWADVAAAALSPAWPSVQRLRQDALAMGKACEASYPLPRLLSMAWTRPFYGGRQCLLPACPDVFYLIPHGVIPFHLLSSSLDICKETKGPTLVAGNIS